MDSSKTPTGQSTEKRLFRPGPQHLINANLKPEEYARAMARAQEDHLGFWEDAARELSWFRAFDAVLDDSDAPFYRWYPGGKCNIVHNALDRHADSDLRHKQALIWEGEDGARRTFTYFELRREVNRLANALRSLGVGRGDRVVVFLPPLPETAAAMLAAAKIGASHCLVFTGFSAKVLRRRIMDTGARIVFTADGFYRNGREIALKPVVDQALSGPEAASVETVVMVRRTGSDVELSDTRDVLYDDLTAGESAHCETEVVNAEDELFLLHSSGGAAEAKGVVHSHGGYMVGLAQTMRWALDFKGTDILWCTADPAWITGHGYAVYGPLLAGGVTLLYEGHPLGRNADKLLDVIERRGVTILYTTPTIIRMLKRFGDRPLKRHDPGSLRLLLTVGEPIAPEVWLWFHKTFGAMELPLLDTLWQTETGAICISPLPISLLKPGSVGRPLPGIAADVVDKDGEPAPPDTDGFLVLKKPWPAMLKTLHNDPEGCKKAYWSVVPGAYWTGDAASRDEDGYYWIRGRADDVLNFAGHRIGAVELENALTSHKGVREAAVIGVPDAVKGQAAKAFVVPARSRKDKWTSEEELVRELKRHVRREIGPIATIKAFAFLESLPKTESGTTNRRRLKDKEHE